MSTHDEYFNREHSMESDWQPYADLFTGDTPIKDRIRQMAQDSSRLGPELIADAVASDIATQYLYARDYNRRIHLITTTGIANIFANNVMKIVGLGASLWVDVAIFGAAAVSLFGTHLNALAIGSAIFATWLGLKHGEPVKKQLLPFACVAIASLGASLVLVSSDPVNNQANPNAPTEAVEPNTRNLAQANFKRPFSEFLANRFERGSTVSQQNITTLETQINGFETDLREQQELYNRINGDGYRGNDDQLPQVLRQIEDIRTDRTRAVASLGDARAQNATAVEQDPVEFWATILATLYISVWLFSSQMLVANIIGGIRKNYRENQPKAKSEAQKRKTLTNLLNRLENPNDVDRRNFIHMTVAKVTTQFSAILYNVAPEETHKEKHDKFADLFQGENREKIHSIAFKYIDKTVVPRGSERNRASIWSIFNRKQASQFQTPSGKAGFEQEQTRSTGPEAPKPAA